MRPVVSYAGDFSKLDFWGLGKFPHAELGSQRRQLAGSLGLSRLTARSALVVCLLLLSVAT
jgi:hypothetical protein